MAKAIRDFFEGMNIPVGGIEEIPKQKMCWDEVNENANIPKRFEDSLFEKYGVDEKIAKFATEKDNDKICVISGTVGQGKTTILCSSIHERCLAGLNAGYYFSNSMLHLTLRSLRSFSSKTSELDFVNKLGSVSYLCLDEVGSDIDSVEELEFLKSVISLRYDNKLPTMIATNLTFSKFRKFILGIPVEEEVQKEELVRRSKENPFYDRVNSLVIPIIMQGSESFRKNA